MIAGKIFEHARRTPGKTAIVYGTRVIDYSTYANWISHAREFLGREIAPGAKSLVLVELDGPVAEVATLMEEVGAICRANGASEIRVSKNEEERMVVWKGRKAAFAAGPARVDEKAKSDYLAAAFSDAIAVYLLSLCLDVELVKTERKALAVAAAD